MGALNFPVDGFTGTETFTFSAYDGAKNSATATGTVTVVPGEPSAQAPSVDTHPASQVVAVGSTATFSVVASGGILSYQWYRGGWPLSGATEATFVLPAVSSADVGTYVVVVTDDVGSTASTPANLSVVSGVTLTRQPVSQTVISGSSVTFTVAATGSSPITYQWTRNGSPISGATSASLRLSGVTSSSAGNYQARVTNPAGSVLSDIAVLTVQSAPRITSFSPTSGGLGTAVTLTGVNLTGATSVRFNGTAAPFTVVGPGTIVAGVPRGATTGRIAVTTATGTATSSSNYTVGSRLAVPTLTGLSPTSGPAGTRVVMTGANLGATTSARIGSRTASYTVLSANQVRVIIPAEATSARITLTTPAGSVSSSTFTVTR